MGPVPSPRGIVHASFRHGRLPPTVPLLLMAGCRRRHVPFLSPRHAGAALRAGHRGTWGSHRMGRCRTTFRTHADPSGSRVGSAAAPAATRSGAPSRSASSADRALAHGTGSVSSWHFLHLLFHLFRDSSQVMGPGFQPQPPSPGSTWRRSPGRWGRAPPPPASRNAAAHPRLPVRTESSRPPGRRPPYTIARYPG